METTDQNTVRRLQRQRLVYLMSEGWTFRPMTDAEMTIWESGATAGLEHLAHICMDDGTVVCADITE